MILYTLLAPVENAFSACLLKQEKSGGALRLELGTQAVFKGTADFVENSVMSTNFQGVEQRREGGAMHNKVLLILCWLHC